MISMHHARRAIVHAPLALLVAAAVSCGASAPAAEGDPQLVLGRQVFTSRCATCHAPNGAGGVGPKLAGGAVVAKYPNAADQRVVIANGRNGMPKWSGILTDAEIDAVVRYTREKL